jgi:hypothetical protein
LGHFLFPYGFSSGLSENSLSTPADSVETRQRSMPGLAIERVGDERIDKQRVGRVRSDY